MIFPDDLVTRGHDSDSRRYMRVLANDNALVRVEIAEGYVTTFFARDLVLVQCRNCHQGRSAHNQDGTCLYGPGSWEEP